MDMVVDEKKRKCKACVETFGNFMITLSDAWDRYWKRKYGDVGKGAETLEFWGKGLQERGCIKDETLRELESRTNRLRVAAVREDKEGIHGALGEIGQTRDKILDEVAAACVEEFKKFI